MPVDIRSLSREALAAQFTTWSEPGYRLDQVLGWLYPKRAASWDEMSNLPKTLRQRLAGTWSLHLPELVRKQGSRDTTLKFLWRLEDGSLIESVLIPATPALYGERSDRHTLCISTQVGCAYGCRFCASGLDGWKRNLEPHEIVGQVLAVERWAAGEGSDEWRVASGEPAEVLAAEPGDSASPGPGSDENGGAKPPTPAPGLRAAPSRIVNNVVVMGMGEPLANYANLLTALRLLNAPWGGGIGARKITISTSGLAPQIRQLASEPEQFGLAISLHGATDEVRAQIMPVNRKFPLATLMDACAVYQGRKGRMLTFEYILIAGVNDAATQVRPLADLARRLHAKVNLIPYNTVEGLQWRRPPDAACEAFASRLEGEGITTTLRREKGHDIDAACGQLRLRTEKELALSETSGA